MKFSVFEILEMVKHGIIQPCEARQILKINEHLTPEEPQTGKPGSVPDVNQGQQDVTALPLSNS